MKILQIVYSLSDECGGPVISIKKLAQVLANNGHKICIYGTQTGIKNVCEKSIHGYTVYEFPTQRPHRYFYSPQLKSFLKKTVKDYDVVHIHGIWTYPAYVASKVCRSNHIPYIVRTCGMLEPWSLSQKRIKKLLYFYLIEKRNLKNASYIQFSTEIEFKKSFYKNCDSHQVQYIENILSLDEINNTNIQLDSRLAYKRYILFFGRLCYQKGLDVLIKAYDLLRRDPLYRDIYLVLMGSDADNYFGTLKKNMSHLEIWDKVINLGMIYGSERFSIVKRALFLCLPSRQENLGLTILETFACGVPVLVSELVDIAHFIETGHLGRLSMIDPIHLSFLMKEMIDSDKDRIEMGQNAKRFVYRKFSNDVIYNRYMDMYRKTITRNNKFL